MRHRPRHGKHKRHAPRNHCCYSACMPVSMTIRDVPDETRAELAARADRAGQSLQEYVRAQLTELATRRSPDALWDRVQHRLLATGSRLPAEEILEMRDADRA